MIPTTYAQWLDCFDKFKTCTNDREVLEDMKKGSLDMNNVVAQRFAVQINNVINTRLNTISKRFERQTNVTDINAFINALLSVRKEFKTLTEFAQLSVLPRDSSNQLVKAIREQADTMQKSLEDSSRNNDRTGTLTSILKRNRINNF